MTGRAVLEGCASLMTGADGRAKAASGVGRFAAGAGLLGAESLAAGGGLLGAESLVASGGLLGALLVALGALSAAGGPLGGVLGAAAGGAKGVAMPIRVCERSELERATGAAGGWEARGALGGWDARGAVGTATGG
jgi:hypothetical protein